MTTIIFKEEMKVILSCIMASEGERELAQKIFLQFFHIKNAHKQ